MDECLMCKKEIAATAKTCPHCGHTGTLMTTESVQLRVKILKGLPMIIAWVLSVITDL